jgi:hypothetical protein
MRLHCTNYKILIGDLINSWNIKICHVFLTINLTFKKLKTYVHLTIIDIKKTNLVSQGWFFIAAFLT